jgi:hypothetical protein
VGQPLKNGPTLNEQNTQRLVVAWFRDRYPEYKRLFFHIPNGGKRNAVTAKQLHDAGVVAGVPDLMLALPRHGFGGLFLELKTTRGALSSDQRTMQAELVDAGYAVETAYGYEQAKDFILEYLGDTHS